MENADVPRLGADLELLDAVESEADLVRLDRLGLSESDTPYRIRAAARYVRIMRELAAQPAELRP